MSRLLEMLDIKSRARAVDAITAAIEQSFSEDKSRQTQDEIKHRFNICVGMVAVMRNDLGWSWQRIHDNMPYALRCKLDNGDWTPQTRSAWAVDSTSGLILPPGAR